MTNSPLGLAVQSAIAGTYMDIQSWTRLKHRPASASSSLSSSDPTLRLLWEERDIPREDGQACHKIQLQERDVLKAHKGKERLCTCVPVYLCTCVPVYLCTCVPVYLCTCVPVYLGCPSARVKGSSGGT